MNDSVKEQLSACLDGELPRAELQLLLKRVGKEAELRAALGRYALVSAALKDRAPAAASRNFAANVMAAIDAEPASATSRIPLDSRLARRLRPVAGFAVAASVAALAIMTIQRDETAAPPELVARQIEAPVASAASDPEPSYTVPSTISRSAFVPATRLTNYVVAHSEYSSPLGRRSVLSGVLSEDEVEIEAPEDSSIIDTRVTHP